MGIDACPMEGFDADTLNQTLGLSVQGLQASVVVPVGFRREDDFNARLPKSRWPAEKIFTLI